MRGRPLDVKLSVGEALTDVQGMLGSCDDNAVNDFMLSTGTTMDGTFGGDLDQVRTKKLGAFFLIPRFFSKLTLYLDFR